MQHTGAFTVRDAMAQLLEMPVSQIRVIPMEIGGGFGGKIPVYLEPVAALLSRKTGQAVKILMSRADVFEASGPTCGSWSRVKIGAKSDGPLRLLRLSLPARQEHIQALPSVRAQCARWQHTT